jgi:hypothetical protein
MDVWFWIEQEPPPRGAKASWRDLKTFVSAPPGKPEGIFHSYLIAKIGMLKADAAS